MGDVTATLRGRLPVEVLRRKLDKSNQREAACDNFGIAPVRKTEPYLRAALMPRPRKPASQFRYFNSSPEVIHLVLMMYVRFPCRCGIWRTCCSSAGSTSATRGCGTGRTVSMNGLGNADKQEVGRWANNQVENAKRSPFVCSLEASAVAAFPQGSALISNAS